jgi:hypothetical protein
VSSRRRRRRVGPPAYVADLDAGTAYLLGKVLQPGDFSGGEAAGQANDVPRQLGFAVARNGEGGGDWSEHEVTPSWSNA